MYGYIIQKKDKDFEILNGEIIENNFVEYQSESYLDFFVSLRNQYLSYNKIFLAMAYDNELDLPINEFIVTKESEEMLDFIDNKKHYNNISLQGFASEIDSLDYLVDYLGDCGKSYNNG